jgi:hypothetical protein
VISPQQSQKRIDPFVCVPLAQRSLFRIGDPLEVRHVFRPHMPGRSKLLGDIHQRFLRQFILQQGAKFLRQPLDAASARTMGTVTV